MSYPCDSLSRTTLHGHQIQYLTLQGLFARELILHRQDILSR
jgi:hypothetical protein